MLKHEIQKKEKPKVHSREQENGGFSLNRNTNKSTNGTIKAGLYLSLFLNTPSRKITPFQN